MASPLLRRLCPALSSKTSIKTINYRSSCTVKVSVPNSCLVQPIIQPHHSAVSGVTDTCLAIAFRSFSTRATASSLNDPNPNWSNRPPKETILLDGCDFEHWLVVMEKPEGDPTRDEIIDSYIKTLAMVVGSEQEARMKIYSVSTRCYYAFGALVSEELSYKIKELPRVRWVLPDSYLDVRNKDYGGEPFINGEAVPYDPKYHEEWIRNNAKAQERNRRGDRPRNFDRSRNFERRRENMQYREPQTHNPPPNMAPVPQNTAMPASPENYASGPQNYNPNPVQSNAPLGVSGLPPNITRPPPGPPLSSGMPPPPNMTRTSPGPGMTPPNVPGTQAAPYSVPMNTGGGATHPPNSYRSMPQASTGAPPQPPFPNYSGVPPSTQNWAQSPHMPQHGHPQNRQGMPQTAPQSGWPGNYPRNAQLYQSDHNGGSGSGIGGMPRQENQQAYRNQHDPNGDSGLSR